MSEAFVQIGRHVAFSPDRGLKVDLVKAGRMFAGLNTFEPGQGQRVHVHPDADKFYLIVTGKARMTVGAVTREAGEGTLVWAPAGTPHGVDEALERTVMLVAMSPPPA